MFFKLSCEIYFKINYIGELYASIKNCAVIISNLNHCLEYNISLLLKLLKQINIIVLLSKKYDIFINIGL